jgi:hypothetical protein
VGRSAFSLGALFTGAMAGAVLNSRETRRLGQEIRADLRREAESARPPAGWEPPAIDEPAWPAPHAQAPRQKARVRLRRRAHPTTLPPGEEPST